MGAVEALSTHIPPVRAVWGGLTWQIARILHSSGTQFYNPVAHSFTIQWHAVLQSSGTQFYTRVAHSFTLERRTGRPPVS